MLNQMTPSERLEHVINSVNRRTAGDCPEVLRLKLAVAELNEANALDERDYLLGTEWKPVVEDVALEIEEALRLSQRLDYMDAVRVKEILTVVLTRFSALRQKKA